MHILISQKNAHSISGQRGVKFDRLRFMDITCPNCSTHFAVPDGAIYARRAVTLKCSKCGHMWKHMPPGSPLVEESVESPLLNSAVAESVGAGEVWKPPPSSSTHAALPRSCSGHGRPSAQRRRFPMEAEQRQLQQAVGDPARRKVPTLTSFPNRTLTPSAPLI